MVVALYGPGAVHESRLIDQQGPFHRFTQIWPNSDGGAAHPHFPINFAVANGFRQIEPRVQGPERKHSQPWRHADLSQLSPLAEIACDAAFNTP